MDNYTKTFGTGVIPTFDIRPGQGNTSWMYGGDESKILMDEYLADRAAKKAELKDDFTNNTIPTLNALLNPDEPEADPLDAYFEQANAEAEAAQLSKELNANAAAVQAMTSDDAYTYTPEDQAALEASELGEDIMTAGGMLGGGPAAQYLGARQGLDLVDSAQAKIRGGESVKNTIKKALNAPGIKGQLAKKIAMRAALMGTGPVGIAILLGDLAYMGAKAGSGYLADKGYIEQDYVGNFEDAVGESAGNFMDMIRGNEDFEVGSNTKADGGRIGLKDGANESFYVNDRPVSEEVYDLKGRQMDLNPTGMEAFKQMTEQFSDVAPEQIMDIIEDKFPQYMEDPTDPFAGMAYGGRVGLQAGGMPFTPFMAPNYAAQYYNQNFNVPTIVPPAIQPIVDPDANNSGATPPEGFGSLGPQKPVQGPGSKGPEDRMEGFRPQDNPLSFSNPANQTTMKFVDGKLVYDNVNPYLRTGVAPGDEVPVASPLFAGLNLLGGLFGFDKKKSIDDEIAEDNLKAAQGIIDARKAEEAAAAKAAEEAAAAKALADEQALAAKEEAARRSAAEQKAKEMADARARRQAASTEASRNAAVTRAQQNLRDNVNSFNNNPSNRRAGLAMTATGDVYSTRSYSKEQRDRNRQNNRGVGRQASKADRSRAAAGKTGGGFCFDPNTLVQMFDGSEKRIKDIKLGDKTKGGEVTGVFQFKAADEIHNYKGVIVAGSHYVKEDGRFIMVQDSPRAVKIDKIPVVHSLDTTGRRIWINDIEFADYNGDGIAKGFLANAGVDLTGFDQEVLRQVEHRLI